MRNEDGSGSKSVPGSDRTTKELESRITPHETTRIAVFTALPVAKALTDAGIKIRS